MKQREIKFRAWDGKRMTTSGIMFNSTTGCLVVPDGSQMKLMQFTGLHDKNGVEIYEGDIVVYPSQDCNGTPYKDTYEVIFYDPEFKLSTIKSHIWKKGAKIHLNDTVEIIGNIHQNPELL